MAVKRKKLRLIFLLRAGFLTLVVIIITVGLFTSATMRDGARNVQQVVEDQKLLAKNMIASKEKMDFVADQMGQAGQAVSALRSMGMKNSETIAEVGIGNKKNVENMQKIVATIQDFIQKKEPLIRDLNALEVLVSDALIEMDAIMGGYKEDVKELQKQMDVLFNLVKRIKKRVTDKRDQKDFEKILKLGRVFAGIVEEFNDLFYEGAALQKVAETGQEGREYVIKLKKSISALRKKIAVRVDAEMSKAVNFAQTASREAEGSLSLLNESLKHAHHLQVGFNKLHETAVNSQNKVAVVATELTDFARAAGEVVINNETFLKRSNKKLLITFILSLGMAPLFGLIIGFFTTRYLSRSLAQIIEGLSASGVQVASTAGQVSAASQQLADGASDQAASLEETSSSLEEMAAMSRETLQLTLGVEELMHENMENSGQSLKALGALVKEMNQIEAHSDQIGQIIKTIDQIAFQTNLLALNAAVEAARAGEAGDGFAVVADEVRNLAMRAAEASKSTQELLEGNMQRISKAARSLDDMSSDFEGIIESAKVMEEKTTAIAKASEQQATGIEQVSKAANEMDKVTQQVAANSEESASASVEMSAEAERMQDIVGELVALVGDSSMTARRVSHAEVKTSTTAANRSLSAPDKRAESNDEAGHKTS